MEQAIEKTIVIIVLVFFLGLLSEQVGDTMCSEEYIFTPLKALWVMFCLIAIAGAGYISGKAN